MNKTRSHLHMFKKITHHWFKYSPFICTSWIEHVDFLHFLSSKIHVSPTGIISSIFPPQCRLSSGRRRHTAAPCLASFPWSENELTAFASSSGSASSCCLPSQSKTEALNPHYHRWPPSLEHSTPTLHCYKKIILILVTLSITQLRLHFTSSLAKAPSSLHITTPTVTN